MTRWPMRSVFSPSWRVSLRRRRLAWRAYLSIPVLLAAGDERKVVSLVAAVNGAGAIVIISGLSWLVDLPLLFPALGPSAFILFSSPFSPAAAPRSVVVGHFAALAAGATIWHLVSFASGAPVSLELGGWPTLISASLTLAACCALLIGLSCPHAPACATGLIVALGAAGDAAALLGIAVGVVLLTAQAVAINRFAGLNVPAWSPSPRHRQAGPERL